MQDDLNNIARIILVAALVATSIAVIGVITEKKRSPFPVPPCG